MTERGLARTSFPAEHKHLSFTLPPFAHPGHECIWIDPTSATIGSSSNSVTTPRELLRPAILQGIDREMLKDLLPTHRTWPSG